MKTATQALAIAARQFREYEAHHRREFETSVRGGNFVAADARDEKAERNREMAEMCEQASGRAGANFQDRVGAWMLQCFTPEIAADKIERGDRLLEEVFEILQAGGYDPARIAEVRDYVWARPIGEIGQEVGGTMVCLAALCNAYGVDFGVEAETELERIMEPETMTKIRAKQAAKPKMSPRPQ